MPSDPRDPHAEDRRQAQLDRYDEAMVEYRATDPQARAHAVTQCGLCDDDGYRGNRVCDHREHYESTAGGRAEARAVLEEIRARRGGAA